MGVYKARIRTFWCLWEERLWPVREQEEEEEGEEEIEEEGKRKLLLLLL